MTNNKKEMFDEITKIFNDEKNEEITIVRLADFIKSLEGKEDKILSEFFAAKLIAMRVLIIFSKEISAQLFELKNEKENSFANQLNLADLITALSKASSFLSRCIKQSMPEEEKESPDEGKS